MRISQLKIAGFPLLFSLCLMLPALAACTSEAVPPTPDLASLPGPSWTAQEAINKLDQLPVTTGELAWNAEFDRYSGRWQLTLVYNARKLYPPRDERRTLRWYVYEDIGRVEGPFK